MTTADVVQITQVLPPRDALSLDDHELLGFAKREHLRRFLLAHHVPVIADGKNLRFQRADFLAGMDRGKRVLATARRTTAVRVRPTGPDASAKQSELARAGLKLVGAAGGSR